MRSEATKIEEEIELKVEERHRAWRSGDSARSTELEGEIHSLYGELRVARAQEQNGHRDMIVRRARIERELEKLMSD